MKGSRDTYACIRMKGSRDTYACMVCMYRVWYACMVCMYRVWYACMVCMYRVTRYACIVSCEWVICMYRVTRYACIVSYACIVYRVNESYHSAKESWQLMPHMSRMSSRLVMWPMTPISHVANVTNKSCHEYDCGESIAASRLRRVDCGESRHKCNKQVISPEW